MSSIPPDSKAACAVLVAAGRSTRMSGTGARKPFLEIAGRTVLETACEAFDRCADVVEIVVVGHQDDLERIRSLAAESASMKKVRKVVSGGAERSDSVRAGVEASSERAALVAIHDVARPLVAPEVVERAIAVAAVRGAALVAVPASDTTKTSSDGRNAESTLDRSVLWCAQTPQVFRRSLFLELLERARADGYRPTDDSALHETYVGPVPIVPGDARNLKITRPEDLVIAAAIRGAASARVGVGFDSHPLVAGRPCVLGGVALPHAKGPLGHSDGDAVLHAVADALLGAAGQDDLGTLFPDDDPRWKGADSAALLGEVAARVRGAGYAVANVDVVVATDGPRIAPHRPAMRERIAAILGIGAAAVNVKGKSLEGLGGAGSRDAVAVHAVCLLERAV